MIPRRLFWALDFAIVALGFAIAYTVWPEAHRIVDQMSFGWVPPALRPEAGTGALPRPQEILWAIVIAGVTTIVALGVSGGYQAILEQSRTRVWLSSLFAPLCGAGVVTLVLFLGKEREWSRLFVIAFIVLSGICLGSFRSALRQYFRRRRDSGYYQKKVLVVGPLRVVLWLERYFDESVEPAEYAICGYLSVPADVPVLHDAPRSPHVGAVADLSSVLISRHVDEVIAVQPNGTAEWMNAVIENCDMLGILLRIVPESLLAGKTQVLHAIYPYSLLHLPCVVLVPRHFDSDALFFKRLIDVVVSAMALVLLFPLFAVIAIAIKLSDRRFPVFYRWNVVGRNGVRFTGYKFTTMKIDADERRQELLASNEMSGPVFKIRNDPRVTRLGRFLRKFSLNELPQLWSVLKGDMSLVGPRPAFPHELDGYGFWHKRKLSVRPGLTCLWQVSGRNAISNFDDWVRMDLQYIDNWSLWLDFKIFVRTAWVVLAGTGS